VTVTVTKYPCITIRHCCTDDFYITFVTDVGVNHVDDNVATVMLNGVDRRLDNGVVTLCSSAQCDIDGLACRRFWPNNVVVTM